jgi:hypothetical protein
VREERRASLRRLQGVEEGDPDQDLVLAAGRGRHGELPAKLPPPGRRDPVEVAAGSAARPEHLHVDPTRPPQPGQGGVDLRQLRSPDVIQVLTHRAFEVVTGARLLREKPEKDVRKRHAKTISN